MFFPMFFPILLQESVYFHEHASLLRGTWGFSVIQLGVRFLRRQRQPNFGKGRVLEGAIRERPLD